MSENNLTQSEIPHETSTPTDHGRSTVRGRTPPADAPTNLCGPPLRFKPIPDPLPPSARRSIDPHQAPASAS